MAKVICEFLDYLQLPEQYHVAREYQIYGLFHEMMSPMKRLNNLEKTQLKHISFANIMMNAVPDQRRFIRDIKKLIKDGTYTDFFAEQQPLEQEIENLYAAEEIHGKQDIDSFAQENRDITEKLQMSMERALQKSRSRQMKNKPIDNLTRCIDLLTEVDPRLFVRMNPEEKESLQAKLNEIANIAAAFQKELLE